MEINAILGIIIIGLALGFIVYITLWSRWAVERINNKEPKSAREILKDLKNER